VIKLHKGSLFIHLAEALTSVDRRIVRVDSEDGSVYIEAPGIYRIDREFGSTSLKVFRGMAEISGERETVAVYSGERSQVRNLGQPDSVRTFNALR
jgi:hypothetical protein